MLNSEIADYSAYLKLDFWNNFQVVQNVIDNMITRLEELNSVIQMIKLKNNDCSSVVTEDLCKYRNEINILSKKVLTLHNVILQLQSNTDALEKQVEKAELDFGVNNDNKIKKFLKPFFRRNKEDIPATPEASVIRQQEKLNLTSVLDNFVNAGSS